MKIRKIKKIVQYLLLAIIILMILTGLGITQPGIIGSLTFGILEKMPSFRLHYFLWGPFVIILIVHVYLSLPKKEHNYRINKGVGSPENEDHENTE